KYYRNCILLAGIIIINGCYYDNKEDLYPDTGNCDTTNIGFTTVIKPIVDQHCATSGCHLGASPTGYDFSNYEGFAKVAHNGKLIPAIEHTGPNPMPEGTPKLDYCTLTKIKLWVA